MDYQSYWNDLCLTYHPFVLDCLFPFTCSAITFTLFNIPFLILDVFGKPKSLMRYKIQPKEHYPHVPMNVVRKTLIVCLFNVYVVGFSLFVFLFYARQWTGYKVQQKLPTIYTFFRDILVFSLIEDFAFYYTHRLFHTPFFYKMFHKKHHEWTSPIGLSSRYCHPFEHLVSYEGPTLLGPFLCGSDSVTLAIWSTLSIIYTVSHHCGYKFPFLPSPEFHDYHHEKFNTNFGIFGIFDLLHGTQAYYTLKEPSKTKTN